jgi:hypothetical protein
MSAIAPIWIMAEFRFLLSNMGGLYNVPRQEFIDAAVALHVRGAAAGVFGRRRGEVNQGRNVRPRNEDPVPDTALVDFSFFANSSSRTSQQSLDWRLRCLLSHDVLNGWHDQRS